MGMIQSYSSQLELRSTLGLVDQRNSWFRAPPCWYLCCLTWWHPCDPETPNLRKLVTVTAHRSRSQVILQIVGIVGVGESLCVWGPHLALVWWLLAPSVCSDIKLKQNIHFKASPLQYPLSPTYFICQPFCRVYRKLSLSHITELQRCKLHSILRTNRSPSLHTCDSYYFR